MVTRSPPVVQARLTNLKRRMLPVFLLGIPLGVIVFYLTGGVGWRAGTGTPWTDRVATS
jgi:hypothetical protein